MTVYTNFSSQIWSWEPWVQLPTVESRLLWIALYTTPEARAWGIGLFVGSVLTMAEAARMPADVTQRALDTLLEYELVEFDPKTRVLRLTQLPDAGEAPTTPQQLLGLWRRFQSVPACPIRDAHVQTIQWMVNESARIAVLKGNPDRIEKMVAAWTQSFGSVEIPAPRKRGVRRLLDASTDTSTPVQPSLFDRPVGVLDSAKVETDPAHKLSTGVDGTPLSRLSAESGSAIQDTNPSPSRVGLGYHPRPTGEGEGEGKGSSSFLGSGSGPHPEPIGAPVVGSTVHAGPRLTLVPNPISLGESTSPSRLPGQTTSAGASTSPAQVPTGSTSAASSTTPPVDVAVTSASASTAPALGRYGTHPSVDAPWTPATLVSALCASYRGVAQNAPPDATSALCGAIADLVAAGATPTDLAAIGAEIRGGLYRGEIDADPQVPPDQRIAWWGAQGGRLVAAMADAREDARVAAAKSDTWSAHLASLGMGPGGGS